MGRLSGRKRSPESIMKTAIGLRKGSFFNCWNCDKQFWRSPFHIKKGDNKFCSRSCYMTWQKGKPKMSGFKLNPRNGDKNPNWKGGITPKNSLIRTSKNYKEWRQSVFARDNWTCQECGARSSKDNHVFIEAHHIKPFATHPDLRLDISNGVTLCKKCHSHKPKGIKVYDRIATY